MCFTAVITATLLLITMFASSICFGTCWGTGNDVPTSPGTNTVLKTLVEGSQTEMKEVIGRPGIKASIIQLQHLELPRDKRRRRNRRLMRCLADRQAKAFAKLKQLASLEACSQIIDDFTYSPSCTDLLRIVV